MGSEELRRRPFGRRLPCNSFDSVLAELERRGMCRIGPGTAGAIEPMRLVHSEKTVGLLYDGHLTTNGIGNRFQSAPPRRCTLVIADAWDTVFAHCALRSRGNAWPRDILDRMDAFPSEIIRDHRKRMKSAQVK